MNGPDEDQRSIPEMERNAFMTVGMALKLSRLTIGQACERAWQDTELQIHDADALRQTTEDGRSIHRNKNRAYVLLVGLSISLIWPYVATSMFNSNFAATFASALGYVGDLAVTFYALKRRY